MKARFPSRWISILAVLCALLLSGYGLAGAAKDLPVEMGPDVVHLNQLSEVEDFYEPVPFDHKMHASMAEMAGGCETCHHHSPRPTTQPVAGDKPFSRQQTDAARHPACRTCHEIKRNDLRQPGLKGAYHRQCLNCHRDWQAENACVMCHQPRARGKNGAAAPRTTTPDDILGRMHPPIPEPETKVFKAKFTPADGGNILFRHKQHIDKFGIRCVTCHQEENCSRCHAANPEDRARAARKIVGLDRAWSEVHARCSACHRREDKCNHCHYKDDQSPPQPFEHTMTGQVLDRDHATVKCRQCHTQPSMRGGVSCGTAECHKSGPVSFPEKRPGPVVPVTKPTAPKPGSLLKTAVSAPGGAGAADGQRPQTPVNASAQVEVTK